MISTNFAIQKIGLVLYRYLLHCSNQTQVYSASIENPHPNTEDKWTSHTEFYSRFDNNIIHTQIQSIL